MSHWARPPIAMPELDAGRTEIGMAPLIDVVFLLLIFFMVTTVFPENRGIVIEKPESSQSEALAMKKTIFVVDQQGVIFHRGEAISVDDVERLVRRRTSSAPGSGVLIRIDRRADTGVLIAIMDACKRGGADQVGVATDVRRPPSP